jgi:hypothetical protein
LFLRWSLINVLTFLFFGALGASGFVDGLHGAALAATVAILIFTIFFTGYGGWLAWRADDIVEDRRAGVADKAASRAVMHDLNHVFHAIWVCQILGIIGALLGYRAEISQAAEGANAQEAVHQVFSALGNGLTATLAGVLCSLLFFVEYRLIEHSMGKDV